MFCWKLASSSRCLVLYRIAPLTSLQTELDFWHKTKQKVWHLYNTESYAFLQVSYYWLCLVCFKNTSLSELLDWHTGLVTEPEFFSFFSCFPFSKHEQQGRYMNHHVSDILLPHNFMNDFLGNLHSSMYKTETKNHMPVPKYSSI